VCPGHHESAGKHKSGKTRHGNRWLGGALGTAAMAAVRTRDTTYLGARYQRLAPRLGKKKALVPIHHSIVTPACPIPTDDPDTHARGGDHLAKPDPKAPIPRLTRQANALGFTIRFDPIQTAA